MRSHSKGFPRHTCPLFVYDVTFSTLSVLTKPITGNSPSLSVHIILTLSPLFVSTFLEGSLRYSSKLNSFISKCIFQPLYDYLRINIRLSYYLLKNICKVIRHIVVVVILDCQCSFYAIADITYRQILYHISKL